MGVGDGAKTMLSWAGLGDAAASKTRGAEHESASELLRKRLEPETGFTQEGRGCRFVRLELDLRETRRFVRLVTD